MQGNQNIVLPSSNNCPCCSSDQAEDKLNMVFAYHDILTTDQPPLLLNLDRGMNALIRNPMHQPLRKDFFFFFFMRAHSGMEV